jgi:kynurenine 3-monooxygenase
MKKVTIVGGGLVGSLLATYLGKRGHEVHVFERRPDMRKANISAGRSINMACSTRGWTALDAVGVGDSVRSAAIPMKGRMMHAVDGTLTFQPYGTEDQAIYSISRGGLNQILMSHAEDHGNATFHFNEKCQTVDIANGSVVLKNRETSQQRTVKSDLVFGADGASSAVRMELQKDSTQLKDKSGNAFRFDYEQNFISHGYKELTIPAPDEGKFLMEKNALHIWPRGEFMLIALPNPDGSFTCTLFLPFEGADSFSELQTTERVLDFFNKKFQDVMPLMPTLLDDFFTNPTSSLGVIRCFPWTYSDKFCLIGDAAHAIVPFYGQGMNAGFEDCTLLNNFMDQYNDDWNTILSEFEKSRKPNAEAIADLALRNFIEMRDLVGDAQFLLRKKIEKKIHSLFPEKFLPLYSMISFSNIPYSEAFAKGKQQDELLDEMMKINGIADKLDSPEIEVQVRQIIAQFK